MKIGEEVWTIVKKCDHFTKETIGKQIVRAADLISSNLSEGFGRFHYKENLNFFIMPEDLYMKQRPGLKNPKIIN